ncbi:telomere length regulator protein rif1 [Diplogelasinospora grovesii]|uniref:Telomere length regulator protein rif1 n=1 Tax=Diplogelasinospora grovesii TaxID=303347 RepID=A0AAN6RZK4_9PEZI|nr:telomere length regulator protein rif1 [Diplogelasinospora grovesii]
MSSLLDVLPPRPPTPPRGTHNEASIPPRQAFENSLDELLSLHTPPNGHSPSSCSIATTSTSRRRKKVLFSVQAEYKEAPVYTEGEARKQQQPTPVSLPRSASKPVKSILKITTQSSNPLDFRNGSASDTSDPNVNLATMLESTIQQLAGGDRDSKVDAYMMLTRALKVSNNLPDRVALQEKMSLFTQFMQRDMVARTPEGSLDASLVNHALNLLITFLHFPAIASTITNDFGVWLVDHCIRSFEDASAPKDVARHLMQVIHIQSFSSKVMTSDRVGRLVASLHNIEEHLKGKSIIMSRVLIYRKLVKQSRQLMLVHSDWLFDLFTDMLSSLKDIRSSAIALGLEAAFSMGHEKQLSRKVMEVFNLPFEEKRYIEFYEERLRTMAKDKHDSAVVPQIWSVVILLLRVPLDKWEFLDPWLHIIQNCFNSSDFPTKISANHAWSRLVYLMHLEERSFSKNLSILSKPLISQLKRKGAGRTSEELRRAVLGGVCNLLYYTFKPSTNPALLDGCWDNTVKPLIAQLIDSKAEGAQENLRIASAILCGLFDCATPRLWREDHIVESALVKPEELPPIDAKWTRRNAARVFTTIEPILERDFLALADDASATSKLWRTLVATVASAASKEIKVSKDTTAFVADAFNVLQRIWRRGLSSEGGLQSEAVNFLLAVRAYLEAMISSLGLLPFTEKPGKNQGLAKVPLHVLFSFLSALPPGVPDDNDFAEFLTSIFAPFFAPKSDKAKMDLAQDLLSNIPMDVPRPYGTWLLVAGSISCWLEPGHNSHHSTGSSNETPVGHDYREIVRLLERGLRSTPNLPWDLWQPLFCALFDRARDETGDAGVAIVAIEPLAKVVTDQFALRGTGKMSSNIVRCVSELLSVATQPRDRQAVDAARRRLWGTALAGSRSASFDTFDNLYKAVNTVLEYLYEEFDSAEAGDAADAAAHLLKEVGGFFDRCNRQLFFKTLAVLQDGLLPWLRDTRKLLGSRTSAVLAMAKSLWDKLSNLIADSEHPEQQLDALTPLFCATFNSSHRYIVNSSVSLWNRLFENVEDLQYPAELKEALIQLQPHVDIVLPGLDVSSGEDAGAGQHPSFVESLDDLSLPKLPSATSSRRGTPRASQPLPGSSKKLVASAKEQLDIAPEPKATRKPRRTTTPKLRHEDSQIQFAAIDPAPAANEYLESQVLTERQKEVRERQKENAGLFPEIRSSPGPKSHNAEHIVPSSPDLPENPTRNRQAATPEREGRFDDYVTSTPTPRRGQAVAILDQAMTDPPSSPPEPRRNPLAAEIRSRSASHSLLEEWQFSSSPISGSPNPIRQTDAVPEHAMEDDVVDETTLPEVEETQPGTHQYATADDKNEQDVDMDDEMVEDSAVFDNHEVDLATTPEPPNPPVTETPSTPPDRHIDASRPKETPKSDNDEFVDAPSSPLPPSPKRSKRIAEASKTSSNNLSFDMNEADERSLLRLVVELDAGKVDPTEYQRTSESPKKKKTPPPPQHPEQGRTPVQDCIVVNSGGRSSTRRSSRRAASRQKSASVTIPSSVVEEQQEPRSSPVTSREGRLQKRKRASSKANETANEVAAEGRKKKRRSEPEPAPVNEAESEDQVLDSQLSQVEEAVVKMEPVDEEATTSSIESFRSSPVEVKSEDEQEQPVAAAQTEQGGDVETISLLSDDQEVQSQIALESQSFSERLQSVHEETPTEPDEAVQDVDMPDSQAQAEEQEEQQPEGQKEKLRRMLRESLGELRSASLSRTEVYEIEDLFMDMRRELYEAERRGRA